MDCDPLEVRRWAPPGIVQNVVNLPTGPVGGAPGPEQVILGSRGFHNACDVALRGIDAAWLNVVVSCFAIYDGVYALLDRRRVGEGLIEPIGNGLFQGLIHTIRGHACDGFEVRAQPLATAPPLATGVEGRMSVWQQAGDFGTQLIPPRSFDTVGNTLGDAIVAAEPATLLSVIGYNMSGATRYFQMFDRITTAPNGTVPSWMPVQIPGMSHFSISQGPIRFQTGLVFGASTTQATKTGSPANLWVSALYTTP